ncbi:MAG TPA: porin [Acidiferrobacterales bacterium]
MKMWLLRTCAASLCLTAGAAQAVEGITINGFLTAGATYGDARPLGNLGENRTVSQDGNITNRVGFTNDSRMGLQISAKVNPKIDVTGQLLARGSSDDFNMKADWAFVTYHVNEPLALRMGKVKLTTFLISDYIEVGFAYPWIRPPQEVYSSNPISTINGVDMLLRFNVGDAVFLFQPYFGQSKGAEALMPQEAIPAYNFFFDPDLPPGTVLNVGFTADHMVGVNTSFGTDAFSVRGGWLTTQVGAPLFGVVDDDVKFASAGFTVDWMNIVMYSEYFRRIIDGGANLAFPNQKGFYGTLGYRIGKFLPHVTYADLRDYNDPVGPFGDVPLIQKSITAGFRYELGSGAALKVEAQQVQPEDGTRGLLIADPNGAFSSDPDDKVMIYSLAVDVVF